MIAYYFSTKERRLRYSDDRPIAVGITHTVEGPLKLCANGLHAGRTPWEALQYAPGPILYQVEEAGEVLEGDDKLCARARTYLAEYDATELLRRFACMQALKNIELIKPYCSTEAYALIVEYLTTRNEALREQAARAVWAARTAAWASAAAVAAAAVAAWAAAEAAVAAARWAAQAAAAEAAAAAAWEATGAAETAAARAAGAAAGAAARAAAGAWGAWAAGAREQQALELNKMVAEATGWNV